MRDVRLVFDERDADKSGRIDMAAMCAAMRALSVDLSDDEIKALFHVSLRKERGGKGRQCDEIG